MISISLFSLISLTLSAVMLLSPVEANRQFDRRSDLQSVPPIWESGYVVPLEGGSTCSPAADCISSLPIPMPEKVLKLLTLARGVLTYKCSGSKLANVPTYVSEKVELYDAAPLLPFIPNEATFNDLVPQFYDYNYSEMKNSTLNCVGTVYSEYGSTVAILTNVDSFTLEVDTTISPPENPESNADWVYSKSQDDSWQIYRVETYGGAVPVTCHDHQGTFDLGFAAEYWFYHA